MGFREEVFTLRTPQENRGCATVCKTIIIGLLYPGVLGAIIYQLLWEVLYRPQMPQLASILVCASIAFHYLWDYVFTATEVLRKQSTIKYNIKAAIFDFLIILSLIIAANSLWHPRLITVEWLLFAMAGGKACTMFWDLVTCHKHRLRRPVWDPFFFVLYLMSGIGFILHFPLLCKLETYLWLAFTLIMIDAVKYAFYIFRRKELASVLVHLLIRFSGFLRGLIWKRLRISRIRSRR